MSDLPQVVADPSIQVDRPEIWHSDAAPRISDKFAGVRLVAMPPTWKTTVPMLYTFVLFYEDLTREELAAFFGRAMEIGAVNPRPVSRSVIELASLFHPLLYQAMSAENLGLSRCEWRDGSAAMATPETYLQSLLFLAGCTLSAAVIQDRFSRGNIESKLSRLWQAAQHARRGAVSSIDPAEIESFVVACAERTDDPYEQLIQIKKMYGRVLGQLGGSLTVPTKLLRAERLTDSQQTRFGGVIDRMRELLRDQLECLIAYGSAVTSDDFADYDLIVVVKDSARALRMLAGVHPQHDGLELNLSVYDHDDFLSFQRCSGDNLDYGALCIYGETLIPVKQRSDLLFRNFSFAFIRMRQLLGMAAHLAEMGIHADSTTTSLYNYFVKIPIHIAKGVRGAMRKPLTKEVIESEMRRDLGYDVAVATEMCSGGQAWRAIADAYCATRSALASLNIESGAFEVVRP